MCERTNGSLCAAYAGCNTLFAELGTEMNRNKETRPRVCRPIRSEATSHRDAASLPDGGNRMNRTGIAARALICGAALAASAAAQAALTSVNPQGAGNGGERCLVGSASRCSGGGYAGAMSLIGLFEKDLGYAPGSFVRVDDSVDRLWTSVPGQTGTVQALARYASDSSRLGFDAGGGFVGLTGVVGNSTVRVNHPPSYFADAHVGDLKQVADQWTTIPVAAGTPFALVLDNQSSGYRITS